MKIIILLISITLPFHVLANDRLTKEIVLRDHQFHPSEINLPSGKKLELVIINQDSTMEEFESFDLKREIIIPAKATKKIKVGPLKSGKYKFFGEFHELTAQGVLNIQDSN